MTEGQKIGKTTGDCISYLQSYKYDHFLENVKMFSCIIYSSVLWTVQNKSKSQAMQWLRHSLALFSSYSISPSPSFLICAQRVVKIKFLVLMRVLMGGWIGRWREKDKFHDGSLYLLLGNAVASGCQPPSNWNSNALLHFMNQRPSPLQSQ